MYMLFLDESGSIGNKESRKFILGGIIISEFIWHELRSVVYKIKEKYKIPTSEELKWRYFYPKAKSSAMQHLSPEQRNELRVDIYNALTGFPSIKAMSVVANLEAFDFKDKDSLYLECYKQIVEQFQNFLSESSEINGNKINGLIICDHMDTLHNNRIKTHHDKVILNDQTKRYDNVIECLFLVDSHLSLGVQLADLVIGAQFRMVDKDDNKHYAQVRELFERNPKRAYREIGGN